MKYLNGIFWKKKSEFGGDNDGGMKLLLNYY